MTRSLLLILSVPLLIALVVKWNIQFLQRSNQPDVVRTEDASSAAAAAADTSTPYKQTSTTKEQQPQSQPLLVLHVGPGKTGSTSLQVDLTKPELQESLGRDGYWYAGRYYNNTHIRPKDGHLDEGKESFSPLLKVLREILIPRKALTNNDHAPLYCSKKSTPTTTSCWKVFRNELDQASKEHNSTKILLSDEPLALRWSKGRFVTLRDSLSPNNNNNNNNNASFLNNEDLSMQPQQQQLLLHWKPLVVVSYRRFYEWLPSSIYQRNRKRLQDTNWPTKGDLHALELLWPNVVTQWREHHYTFMDSLVDQAQQAGIDYRILNIHLVANNSSSSSSSIRTQFLCHVLPNAPRSCAMSRQMDDLILVASSSSAEGNNHSSSSSSSPPNNKRVNARDQETVELMNQDMITTHAATLGMIQQRIYSRTQVREALRKYLVATNQTMTADFEQYCPTRNELDLLFQQSLDMEVKYILPTLSTTLQQQQWLDEHKKGFDQMVASNAFCILNGEAAVHRLRDFFEQFSK